MRNLNIKVLFMLISGFLFLSCEDQGESIFGDGELGANLKSPSTGAFIRGETSEFTIDLEVTENEGVSVQEIIVYGELQATVLDDEGEPETISSGKIEVGRQSSEGVFSLPANEAFEALPVDGQVRSEDDLFPGDQFIFSYELILADGRTLTIATRYRVTFTCPSDLAGVYAYESSGGVGDGSGGQGGSYSGITGEVEVTEEASGIYLVDDMSFGLYPQGYGDTAPPGQIEEVCGSITDRGDVDQYGDPFTITGNLNEDGTIELSWSNTWGDTGNVVLTPVE